MISEIENAMMARLKDGLGRMVSSVGSYGGELEDVGAIARVLPACWVTFLGVQQTRPVSTHKHRFYTTGRFSVLLAAYSVREEAAQRKGGPARDEVGCNRLIRAVRRLMSRQDMGLPVEPLLPGRVRSLFSTRLNSDALAAYACEFDTVWVEEALDNGRWPAPEGDNDPDRLFADYQGRLDTPWPMHERTGLAYHLDDQPAVVAQDLVTMRAKDPD